MGVVGISNWDSEVVNRHYRGDMEGDRMVWSFKKGVDHATFRDRFAPSTHASICWEGGEGV